MGLCKCGEYLEDNECPEIVRAVKKFCTKCRKEKNREAAKRSNERRKMKNKKWETDQ